MLLGDFVDLPKYPIDQLESDHGNLLINRRQQMMATDSICVLPGFLRQNATVELAAEVAGLEAEARRVDFHSTAYGWMDNKGFQDPHPRAQLFLRRCGAITTEQLDPEGLCMRLFQFDDITEFVRRLLGYSTLYRSACPNISVRLNIMQTDDEFGWHFDTNDGVVSFITQNADQGGVFEYEPLIRQEGNENYQQVSRVMSGTEQAKQADTPPGTFTLFLGRRSLHRVSKVGESPRRRQSLLFSYDRKPGMVFPDAVRKRLTEPSGDDFTGLK